MSINSEFRIQNSSFKSLLQTSEWADFKGRHGWKIVPFHNQFLLERSFPGRVKIIYGPELELPDHAEHRYKMISELQNLMNSRRAFVARLDFFAVWSDKPANELQNLGLKKSFEEIQPEFRRWIDLKPDQDAILAQMKPKGRYNIGLADRHGVTVEPSTDAWIFTALLAETAQRDGFSMRTASYYHDMIETLTKNGLGELLVATYQGQPLAAAIIGYSPLVSDQRSAISDQKNNSPFAIRHSPFASYLHGASSSTHREVMAPFLLHWQAMQRAKARHCKVYDLLAVAPPEENSSFGIQNSSLRTKYAGFTRFKEQFGGQTVRMLGAWDLVGQPLTYQIFRTLERLRRH
ncbi:MAG: peptidoglycan bridge formation glycyltransferase FemA/FemB family protein [Patescibacteria group bacterium]